MADDRPIVLDELPTPLQLTNEMNRALFYGKKGSDTIHKLRTAHVRAKEAYLKAHKLHMRENLGNGTRTDREDAAQLDNWDLFTAMNEAELALQYAKEKKDDLAGDLSSAQTKSKLVIKEMEMAGRS